MDIHTAINVIKPKNHYFCEVTMNAMKNNLTPNFKPPTFLTDYYPFGYPIAERSWMGDGYRFGFNGQEKDDEIYGEGTSYTAEFWQYDSRLGRRWNVDPKPNAMISPYACFENNPILFVDLLGDTVRTNQEGFESTTTTMKGTLGKNPNPIGYDSEKGMLTYDESVDVSGYTDYQKDILGRYKELISNETTVNLNIVDVKEAIYKGESLYDINAPGAAVPYKRNGSIVRIDVFVARNPIKNNGTPEDKEYIGITTIHEMGGHAYLWLTQPQLTKTEHNNLVDELHKRTQTHENYIVNGRYWYKHSRVPKHEPVE